MGGQRSKRKGLIIFFNKKKYPKLKIGQVIVRVDKKYIRPLDVKNLIGNAKKARKVLGWKSKTSIKKLISEMMESDSKILS